MKLWWDAEYRGRKRMLMEAVIGRLSIMFKKQNGLGATSFIDSPRIPYKLHKKPKE